MTGDGSVLGPVRTTAKRRHLSLRAYRLLTGAMAPVARLILNKRLRAGKEDPARITERQGVPSRQRPAGAVIWIHGASVGESLSVLPLIERLSEILPHAHFLVTTGTVTSAALMAERLPACAIHQYIPIDQPAFVERFLDHWAPDAALFVESELWPVIIGASEARRIPMALVNGRMSPSSYKGWTTRRGAVRELLDAFDVVLAQDKDNGARLTDLAGREALMVGNLKSAAPPLPTDDQELERLKEAVGGRPVWLAASTHHGEEAAVLNAHAQVAADRPDVLTVIAPRHPTRGDEVAALLAARGLRFARRSSGDLPARDTSVYLADTLGELGIFYRLADIAFIGGSLTETGGHNPMEPARLGTAIVTGPHVFNFTETFQSMREAGALALVRNERDLAASLIRLLTDSRTRTNMAQNASAWAEAGGSAVLASIIAALAPILTRIPKPDKAEA